jgi:crossover junction endodeoxyribonuclease RuvC
MRILGIDPGTTRCGFGIIDVDPKKDFVHVNHGCIESNKETTDGQRLNRVYIDISSVMDEFKPNHIAIESIFFFSNQKTATKIAEARGVLLLAAHKKNIETFEYTPQQVKLAVTGYGRSEKKEVQEEVRKAFNMEEAPKDDAADALAVAIAHFHKMQEMHLAQ